ncbi:MAG: serine/threonine-protein kinase [Terriglobales bacterium]|jgi:serine/threonine-protein kinase
MATMFGRFDIQSELSKSETALIYKALDTETNQVVALKTQSLEPLGDRAEVFVDTLIAEGESTRDLVGQNIVLLYGAGEIDGQFCAAMEYIQGNSIATMLARKEGFSIWDLLDITRQVCAGLEQAAAKGVAHSSLEPAKIMVQWDGMVKILGYGISNMSMIEAEAGKGLGRLMPYCSPEQIRGEAIDLRSNLFTLGAILYEMVVGRPAFDAADPVTLVGRIENEMPASPSAVNPKIQPAVGALIMKALAKDPAERYQSARELLDDLEKCKENGNGKKATTDTKKTTAAANASVSQADRAAAASKFVSSASSAVQPQPSASSVPSVPSVSSVAPRAAAPKPVTPKPVSPKPPSPKSVSPQISVPGVSPTDRPAAETRAAAAAAGAMSGAGGPISNVTDFNSNDSNSNNSNSGPRFISDFEVSAAEAQAAGSPVLSAAVVEQESEQHSPGVAVDPMMSESVMAEPVTSSSSAGKSFSDLAEMPPFKEPVFAAPVPEPAEPLRPHTEVQIYPRKDEKPKIQPREVAEKAMHEIATVPPRLMLFSILGAVGLILVVAIAIFFHVRTEDDGSTAAPRPTKSAGANSTSSSNQPVAQARRTEKSAPPAEPIAESQPSLKVRQVEKRSSNVSRRAVPAPVPVVIPGQALIDSSPQGAQFQVDGKSDPSWVTPFSLIDLSPGKHIISVSKTGYSSDIRSVDVVSGSKSSLLLHLAAVNALVAVNSTPPGANIIIDGKPTGRVTPAQFAVEKGSHTVLLRKPGYLDETVTADLGPAQNFQYAPVLRALGNTEDMRTVGKFNKLFGRGGESTAGMGSINIHTQPKGAQVAINQQVLDKMSPVDVMVGPGNYIVDITLTGFKPVHKIVSVDKGSKAAIDEILERQ